MWRHLLFTACTTTMMLWVVRLPRSVRFSRAKSPCWDILHVSSSPVRTFVRSSCCCRGLNKRGQLIPTPNKPRRFPLALRAIGSGLPLSSFSPGPLWQQLSCMLPLRFQVTNSRLSLKLNVMIIFHRIRSTVTEYNNLPLKSFSLTMNEISSMS